MVARVIRSRATRPCEVMTHVTSPTCSGAGVSSIPRATTASRQRPNLGRAPPPDTTAINTPSESAESVGVSQSPLRSGSVERALGGTLSRSSCASGPLTVRVPCHRTLGGVEGAGDVLPVVAGDGDDGAGGDACGARVRGAAAAPVRLGAGWCPPAVPTATARPTMTTAPTVMRIRRFRGGGPSFGLVHSGGPLVDAHDAPRESEPARAGRPGGWSPGSSSPASSKITTPLHSSPQPCSGWKAMSRAASWSVAVAAGQAGSCTHISTSPSRVAPGWLRLRVRPVRRAAHREDSRGPYLSLLPRVLRLSLETFGDASGSGPPLAAYELGAALEAEVVPAHAAPVVGADVDVGVAGAGDLLGGDPGDDFGALCGCVRLDGDNERGIDRFGQARGLQPPGGAGRFAWEMEGMRG